VSDKPIGLVDLAAQWREIADECEPLVLERLRSGDYLGADTIAAFEREWAEYVGGGVYAVACSSGTDAVELMVRACTPEGATVGVDEATFVATTAGVERAGRSVVANHERVTRDGYTIATWLYGSTCDGEALARQCRERGDVLLEDASQAHGNKKAGTFGDAAAWSLYPSKNLGGIGQGGVVTFKDSVAAAKARRIREHGYDRATDRHFGRGFNMRMDGINADVLRVKLRHLDRWTARRREIAKRYNAELRWYPTSRNTDVLLPAIEPEHAVHLYVMRVGNGKRDEMLASLRRLGVMAQVHYRTDAFGRENDWNRESISLPCHAQMRDSDVERVIAAVKLAVQ
jgi:dTDP-4-amino-4,6-dideoxygalactose transaminase